MILEEGPRYKVKRLYIKPGEATSLQSHHHRSEHWTVIAGTAEVTLHDASFLVGENESAFVPVNARHRLRNAGVIPCEVIEVQVGSYLGEDDIQRFEDQYGRA